MQRSWTTTSTIRINSVFIAWWVIALAIPLHMCSACACVVANARNTASYMYRIKCKNEQVIERVSSVSPKSVLSTLIFFETAHHHYQLSICRNICYNAPLSNGIVSTLLRVIDRKKMYFIWIMSNKIEKKH